MSRWTLRADMSDENRFEPGFENRFEPALSMSITHSTSTSAPLAATAELQLGQFMPELGKLPRSSPSPSPRAPQC